MDVDDSTREETCKDKVTPFVHSIYRISFSYRISFLLTKGGISGYIADSAVPCDLCINNETKIFKVVESKEPWESEHENF